MILKRVGSMLLVLGMAGCATSEGYQTKVSKWVGTSENELVSRLGAPTEKYALPNGSKVLTYEQRRQFTTSDSVFVPGQNGSMGTYEPAGQSLHDMQCKTNYTVASGVVTNVSFSGNDCVA